MGGIDLAMAERKCSMKRAVCVLIENEDMVLGVARRGTKDVFGLPGGKVDPGERTVSAAVREVEEETGIRLDPKMLTKVFEREEGEYLVTTFKYHGRVRRFSQGDAGTVAWVNWAHLFAGPFGDYNVALFAHVAKLKVADEVVNALIDESIYHDDTIHVEYSKELRDRLEKLCYDMVESKDYIEFWGSNHEGSWQIRLDREH